ncbi:cytochrome P450 4d2-like [Bradysia coprophila]|uniref:cytochrome P450 4d2-like n=1 Tax=Bradysia coprophila TaxID=38358 RepID=UPI00187DCC7C|nr:cytochrome P450 4d2-like [Bradysia coprophila]
MFVIIISFLLVVLSLLYDYVKNKRKFDLIEKFPGPVAQPIVGNAFNYAAKSAEDVISLILESHQTYGYSYRTKIYNDVTVWTSDLKIISTVLGTSTKVLTKSPLYNFLKPWIGEGLLTGTGKKWRAERKVMAPMFHSKFFEYFVDVFSRRGEALVEKLKSTKDGDAVDVLGLSYLTALDSICEIMCDERIDALNDSSSEYVKAMTEVMDVLGSRFSSFWTRNEFLYNLLPWPGKAKYNKTLEVINSFSNKVILKRRDHLMMKKAGDYNSDGESASKIVFVDLLLQGTVDGNSLGNDAILDQVNTLTFNGRNSSPVAIAFVLYALGQHKDIQEKVFKEIKNVFGSDKNESITSQQLQDLTYLDWVIKETMRLYPPIPAIARYIEEDICLDDGRIIPADSSLALTLFVAFRNPSIFPEPNEFIPDRFDPNGGVSSTIDPMAFIPFSSGPRNCIGQKYALLLIKTIVVQVLRNYEIIPKGVAPVIFPQIVLRSKNGVEVGLKSRVY